MATAGRTVVVLRPHGRHRRSPRCCSSRRTSSVDGVRRDGGGAGRDGRRADGAARPAGRAGPAGRRAAGPLPLAAPQPGIGDSGAAAPRRLGALARSVMRRPVLYLVGFVGACWSCWRCRSCGSPFGGFDAPRAARGHREPRGRRADRSDFPAAATTRSTSWSPAADAEAGVEAYADARSPTLPGVTGAQVTADRRRHRTDRRRRTRASRLGRGHATARRGHPRAAGAGRRRGARRWRAAELSDLLAASLGDRLPWMAALRRAS